MADFGYTPEVGQVQTFAPKVQKRSKLADLASDVSTLLTAKQKSDKAQAKLDKTYLDDEAKERLNEAQLHAMDEQDKLYEKYNTTADPVERNKFVQEYEDNTKGVSNWYGLEGDNLTTFAKSTSAVTNKLRLYNSNVEGKINDNINTSKAITADFSTLDVSDTANMDMTVINNNKDYLLRTKYAGDTSKYFDDKFKDFGIKVKEAIAGETTAEEVQQAIDNLDIYAGKLGDKVSVNTKDAVVGTPQYGEYHKLRQALLEKKSSEITKLRSSLSQHIKGQNKKAYMETIERIDSNGGYENPDLKQSAIDSWTVTQSKANTAKITAFKKTPDFINGYLDPKVVQSTYVAHGGTDGEFIKEYQAKYDFTQAYLSNPINADLSANPTQAKLVSADVVKKLVLSGSVAYAVDLAGKTGVGGVLKSYATSALGEEDPKVLTGNVQKLTEGYYANQSVMSNNMDADDKSAMFYYNYQLRNGGELGERHIEAVKKGNAEGIDIKAGKEFNDEFAGKYNYQENIKIYSALVKYGVPPQTAVDYIKEDTESHIVKVGTGVTGLVSSMDVDMRGAPNGTKTFDSSDLEEVLTPLVEKVEAIGISGEKKLVYDKTTKDFRLYVDEVPMQDMDVNLGDMIKYNQKLKLLDELTPGAITSRKIGDHLNTFGNYFGSNFKNNMQWIDDAMTDFKQRTATRSAIKLSTNKALAGEVTKEEALLTNIEETRKAGRTALQDADSTELPLFGRTIGETPEEISYVIPSSVKKDPAFIDAVMDVALNSRENATALFTKDGINEYIGFLNDSFSTSLTNPLIVSENGKVVLSDTFALDITNPNGREELKQHIKESQTFTTALIDGDINTLTYTDDVMREVQKAVGVTADGVGGSMTKKAVDGKYGKGTFAKVQQAQKDQFKIQAKSLSKEVALAVGKDIKPKWIENLWSHETADGTKVLGGTYNMGNIKGKYGGKSKDFTVNEYLSPKSIEKAKASGKLVRMGTGSRGTRKEVFVKAPFRKYSNFAESAGDFARLLQIPRYAKVRTATTQREFITELKKAGYFTDSIDAYLKGVQHRDK